MLTVTGTKYVMMSLLYLYDEGFCHTFLGYLQLESHSLIISQLAKVQDVQNNLKYQK